MRSESPLSTPSFTSWLYRAYLDLGTVAPGSPFHVFGLDFAYQSLVDRGAYPRIQASLNPSFRHCLIRATGLTQYAVTKPSQLAKSLRTDRWENICSSLDHFAQLPASTQVHLAWLISKLCFYKFILELIPQEVSLRVHENDDFASLAYIRAFSKCRLVLDGLLEQPDFLEEFEQIALGAAPGIAQIDAHYQMVVQHIKYKYDPAAAEYWQPRHLKSIENFKPDLDEFTYGMVMSRYHRVGGFLPQMHGDKKGVIHEMDLSEHFARSLPRNNFMQSVAADEMIYPVLESRIKEAMWLGDLDLAVNRAHMLTQLSANDPRAWLQLGEVLIESERFEDAIHAYQKCVRVAPPGEEVGWFMMGQCFEELQDFDSACSAYISALQIDPLGVSAAERLQEVAKALSYDAVFQWTNSLLRELGALKAKSKLPVSETYKQLPPPIVAIKRS